MHQDEQESALLSVPTDARIKEASVKKLKYFCLAILALSLLTIPAAAQKSSRSNKGAAATGDARADLVQSENKKKDKDPAPTTIKTRASTRARPRANITPKVTATKNSSVELDRTGRGEPPGMLVVPLFCFMPTRQARLRRCD